MPDMAWWRFFYDLFWITRANGRYLTWVSIVTSPTEWNNFGCIPEAENDNDQWWLQP